MIPMNQERFVTDWQNMALARGLDLSSEELAKLATAMQALEPAYQGIAAGLTHDVEPATTIQDEALEASESK